MDEKFSKLDYAVDILINKDIEEVKSDLEQ